MRCRRRVSTLKTKPQTHIYNHPTPTTPCSCHVGDDTATAAALQQLRSPHCPFLAAASNNKNTAAGQHDRLQRVTRDQTFAFCFHFFPRHADNVEKPYVIEEATRCGVGAAVEEGVGGG